VAIRKVGLVRIYNYGLRNRVWPPVVLLVIRVLFIGVYLHPYLTRAQIGPEDKGLQGGGVDSVVAHSGLQEVPGKVLNVSVVDVEDVTTLLVLS